MTAKIAVGAGRVILVCTMLLAGAYTFYYLYFWQWMRAQIAGTLFVATLVIGATWLVLGRMKRLERDLASRLDAVQGAAFASPPAELPNEGAIRGEPPTAEPDFPWLAPEFSPPRHHALMPVALLWTAVPATGAPRVAVFIPVLLGAGLIVSLVAGLAERTATAAYANSSPGRTVRRFVVGGLVAVVAVIAVVGGIWWAAHYRPVALGAGSTEMTVHVASRVGDRPAVETVEIVGRYCSHNAITGVEVMHVEADDPNSAVLTVSPLLDEEMLRRYGGCLQDAILEYHRLTVTKTVLVAGKDTS